MIGICLAGGKGTRVDPLTRATNKHLLPVYDQLMINYPLGTLIKAGLTKICVVTGGDHVGSVAQSIDLNKDFGVDINVPIQKQEGAGGIAAALKLWGDYVQGQSVFVLLGDNIFEKSLKQGVDRFVHEQYEHGARIFLTPVPDPERFGVAEVNDGRVIGIEEKPKRPKSNLAVTGAYLYGPDVFEIIAGLKPSARGELEITDVNNTYIKRGQMTYDLVDGFWTDAGTYDSLLRASLLTAMVRKGLSTPPEVVDQVMGSL